MIRLFASACIDAPVDLVWQRLAALEDIQLWAEPILRASCPDARSHGVGAERTCELANHVTIQERWVDWHEGQSFQYEATGLPLVRQARNRWSVRDEGAGRTLLTTAAELELKGGILGRLVEPLMGVLMRRMGRNSLAGFKYFVEHGRPYAGKQAELPQAPAGC
jgi:hypothetical protein